MKTLVFLANGAEEIEAITIIDVLRRGGVDVLGVSITDLKRYQGAHDIWSSADCLIDDIKGLDDVEALVIPGGSEGVDNLKNDKRVLDLLKEGNDSGKLIGAICAGPLVLNELGLLEGRSYTCYPSLEEGIKGNYQEDRVVVDGNIVTSQAPATAMEFALELLGQIKGSQVKDEVKQGLIFDK